MTTFWVEVTGLIYSRTQLLPEVIERGFLRASDKVSAEGWKIIGKGAVHIEHTEHLRVTVTVLVEGDLTNRKIRIGEDKDQGMRLLL